jgi:hypothetical protein
LEDELGTVLPEDLSLEALSQFVNSGQYDASTIGPLATEVFDRLTSLLPEGLGTSDSNETFGVPNFVERLADGFQQGLGLSADEAQQIAQQVADGIQGAIDENKENTESSSDGADSSGSDVLGDNPDARGSGSSASGKNQESQGAPRIPTAAEEAARSDIQEFAVNLVLAAGVMAAFEYAVAAGAAALASGEAALAAWWQRVANLVQTGKAVGPELPAAEQAAIPAPGTLSLAQTRAWYNQMVQAIDTSGPLTRELAQRVFDQRNAIREQARDLMADRGIAADLARRFPLRDFQYYVDKYSSQGYSGEALWKRIIEGAKTTNQAINQRFGLQ